MVRRCLLNLSDTISALEKDLTRIDMLVVNHTYTHDGTLNHKPVKGKWYDFGTALLEAPSHSGFDYDQHQFVELHDLWARDANGDQVVFWPGPPAKGVVDIKRLEYQLWFVQQITPWISGQADASGNLLPPIEARALVIDNTWSYAPPGIDNGRWAQHTAAMFGMLRETVGPNVDIYGNGTGAIAGGRMWEKVGVDRWTEEDIQAQCSNEEYHLAGTAIVQTDRQHQWLARGIVEGCSGKAFLAIVDDLGAQDLQPPLPETWQ